MNRINWNAWINELRTTDKEQGRGQLCEVGVDGVKRYCCLGLGSARVPGIRMEFHPTFPDATQGDMFFDGSSLYAPPAFLDWLGLSGNTNGDVHVRIPGGVRGSTQQVIPVSSMNDSGFTFAQIADTLAYFGPEQ